MKNMKSNLLGKEKCQHIRKCLRCDKQFMSVGFHNRVCLDCNYINSTFLLLEGHIVFDVNGNKRSKSKVSGG